VLAPAPTFYIIGIAGNATRWLRSNLDEHPAICAPPIDTQFYVDEERLAALGHRWYREQFTSWHGEEILGERSPGYLDWLNSPGVLAQRIHKQLPDVRLVAIVGDPFERFLNGIARNIRWGLLPADVDPEQFFALESEVDRSFREVSAGIQGQALAPYVERFGDQVLILFLEDIRADPVAAYRSVLEHLGADPSFLPPGIASVHYDDRSVVELPRPSTEIHQALYSWWRLDVEQLEDLTGRDCSAWDPGVNPDTPTPEELMAALVAEIAASQTADAT
jgi:hypothetical protein